MPETSFDEWIAARYETLWPQLFDPAVLDPAVSFLGELRTPTSDRLDRRLAACWSRPNAATETHPRS